MSLRYLPVSVCLSVWVMLVALPDNKEHNATTESASLLRVSLFCQSIKQTLRAERNYKILQLEWVLAGTECLSMKFTIYAMHVSENKTRLMPAYEGSLSWTPRRNMKLIHTSGIERCSNNIFHRIRIKKMINRTRIECCVWRGNRWTVAVRLGPVTTSSASGPTTHEEVKVCSFLSPVVFCVTMIHAT